jgi:tetratricopeptide (TPR) repeat protein
MCIKFAICIEQFAILIALCGCGPRSDTIPSTPPAQTRSTATAPNRQAMRAVSLPDLFGAVKSVASQLNERYADLASKIDDPAITKVDLADAYGEMGKLLMAAGYRESAEPCFLDAQALAPGEMRWPYYLGHLYRLGGETSKSTMSFERALELRPDAEATLVWLGGAYLDQGRPDAAEPLFTKALSLKPRSGAAFFGLGRTALARRDYARAAEYLEQALSTDPKASIIHYRLALAYRGLGRLEEASDQLRQRGDGEVGLSDPLLDELPGTVQSEFAYEHLGIRAFDSRDFAAAAAYFRQALQLAPDSASVRHRLGTTLAVMGDVRGAVTEFQEVLRRSPNFASSHYTLGVLIASTGRYREAIEQFSAAVKSNPSYVEARLQLADALRRSGRPQDSLPQYEQVAALDPRVIEAPLGYAMALAGLKRYQEARDRLIAGMKLYPGRPAFAHALVRLLAAAPDAGVRDGRHAVAIAQDLLSREQPNPDLGEATAMAMAETGRYQEAVTWQHEAMAVAERAGRADLSRRMAENLRLYEHLHPCRRPWRDDDPVGLPDRAASF